MILARKQVFRWVIARGLGLMLLLQVGWVWVVAGVWGGVWLRAGAQIQSGESVKAEWLLVVQASGLRLLLMA